MRPSSARPTVGRASLILALLIAAPPHLAEAARTQRGATIAQAQPQAAQRRSTGVDWTFRDMDIQTLLARLKHALFSSPN